MNNQDITVKITDFLENKLDESGAEGFVVGVSGGIDSAVTSTLCALTGRNTHPVILSMDNGEEPNENAETHLKWLKSKFGNRIDKHNHFDLYWGLQGMLDGGEGIEKLNNRHKDEQVDLAMANLQSRLRMSMLYYLANLKNYLVVGTGNKVEDFGVGFFTKYGDGGVDISPIGDLLKSEVRELGSYLDIHEDILGATPTDGLWEDGRTDEDQLGLSYEEIEDIMVNGENAKVSEEKMERYKELHEKSRHKVEMPPVCQIKK